MKIFISINRYKYLHVSEFSSPIICLSFSFALEIEKGCKGASCNAKDGSCSTNSRLWANNLYSNMYRNAVLIIEIRWNFWD